MEILGLFILSAAVCLAVFAYYALGSIAFAIWRPDKAPTKWVAISELPPVQMFGWFFKYVVPSTLILALVSIVLPLIEKTALF